MMQLWVNLPRKDKAAAPGYQPISAAQIPRVELPDGGGAARVIAGTFRGATRAREDLHADDHAGCDAGRER